MPAQAASRPLGAALTIGVDPPVSRPAVVRGDIWHMRLSATDGPADFSFRYGDPGDIPVVGDWDGNVTDTAGIVRNGLWALRNSNATGVGEVTFRYGDPTDVPLVWASFSAPS